MRLKKTAWLMILLGYIVTGCRPIATPDELVAQPALNLEKKAIKDVVDSFIPQDATLTRLEDSERIQIRDIFDKVDLNADGSDELIFFYKDSDERINMRLLQEKEGEWKTCCDLSLNAMNVIQYEVRDLNGDGKKEMIIGFNVKKNQEESTKMIKILGLHQEEISELLSTPYIAMNAVDLDEDKIEEIILLFRKEASEEARLKVLRLGKQHMSVLDEVVFTLWKDPQAMCIGQIYNEVKAVFIDSNMITEGYTDIFFWENKKLRDFESVHGFKLAPQSFMVPSADIDQDGIIEIGRPFFLPEGEQKEEELVGNREYAVDYYKINSEGREIFARQIYFSGLVEFSFVVPESFIGYYDAKIIESQGIKKVEFSYFSSKKERYPLFEIISIAKKDFAKKKDSTYQLIGAKQTKVLAGKVEDYSSALSGEDKQRYIWMRQDISELKERIYSKDREK